MTTTKKNTTSKRGRGRPKNPDTIPQKVVAKFPTQGKDPEDAPAPDDDLSGWAAKYPPPRNDLVFRKVWASSIEVIAPRAGFRPAHLIQLEILCDLHARYEQLSRFLRMHGNTYETNGRYGLTRRLLPEVGERASVISEIRNFSKNLGLLIDPDRRQKGGAKDEEWE